ncbi:hypothetical protein C0993_010106 [Termitomyces sp. T159_Od127]|nr:hypothetical protein C0993_010106 [Termitomyces sp. T159_Od127]
MKPLIHTGDKDKGNKISEEGYDERARKFWSLYVKEAEQHDKNRTETWKTDMDSTLIFAGLFSAAVTAFLIDSYKLLQPDSSDETRDILRQILAVQIVGASINTSTVSLPVAVTTPPFQPPPAAIAVNVLWFLSLSCSLATALCVTLVQKWIRDYLQKIEQTSQPQRRAMIRGIMFLGSEKWEMSKAVEYIPTLLHLSLFFFFAGLCIFLWNINKATAEVVLGILVICSFCYGVATVAPLFDLSAPYETPFSYLLWRAQQILFGTDEGDFSHVREDLAIHSHVDQEEIQEQLQAVSYVYNRATDDVELQELVGSIPSLLRSKDGQRVWQVFLSKNEQPYQELEFRTVRLLQGCTMDGHLDPSSRQLRATLCIDALLSFSTFFDSFKRNHSSNAFEFKEYILAPWEDDGTLATKAACAETLFHRRSLLDEIPKISSYRNADFLDIANKADQALRDIDDLREILENLLQQSETVLSTHRSDIVDLLKVWMDVVNSLHPVINKCIVSVLWDLPEKLRIPFLPWYFAFFITHTVLRLTRDNQLPSAVNMTAYHILGYLRLHHAYPAIPDVPLSPLDTVRGLWEGLVISDLSWLNWHVCSGMEAFKSSSNRESVTKMNEQSLDEESSNHEHALSSSIYREIQPVTSLLGILKDNVEEYPSLREPHDRFHWRDYCSGHLMLLITHAHGPFSMVATIMDAIVEDEGAIGGLLILISTLKSYKPTKPFKSSVIDQWLETICPSLLSSDRPPDSEGSQVLLVLALLEILVWEREWSLERPFPFSNDTIQHLIDIIGKLTHKLPVELAERAIGVTSHDHDTRIRSLPVAQRISSYIDNQRTMFDLSTCKWRHGQGFTMSKQCLAAQPHQTAYGRITDAGLFRRDRQKVSLIFRFPPLCPSSPTFFDSSGRPMSQVKLILRPPPNVDFVHGYPGIPPGGPDRPQAAVKGTVEVRAGPQGAKTKWVRIELRKVETLPGGGVSNTFYDSVGPSPINLWQSSDEYGVLRSHDFPFSIRIPESIPPSITLENRAGIQYELVASLCTKGKRSFFRKRKSVVVSTQAAVTIDKHELHSTWPIYCQPETRQVIQNGATLVVERNQLCYGPGDRISLRALLRSDALSDTVLRGFELTLREYSRFDPGQQAGKKSVPPQERVATICETKLAINGSLFPGQEHRAELACLISDHHTTTSLNSARHIDVAYFLSVKAFVDNVPTIVMDLPVIVSNWQRGTSQEAIRRIGPTPGLSPGPVQPVAQTVTRTETRTSPTASTLPLSKDNHGHSPPANNFTSLPVKTSTSTGFHGPTTNVDEFGGYGRTARSRTESAASSEDPTGGRGTVPISNSNTTTVGRRTASANLTGHGRRLTVTNNPPEMTTQPETNQSQPAPITNINTNTNPNPNPNTSTVNRPWISAGEEKQRLYEIAKAKVERAQNSEERTTTPPPHQTQSSQNAPTQLTQSASTTKKWPTAEEEKTQLYHKAQAAVLKKQGIDTSPPTSIHDFDGVRVDRTPQSMTSKLTSKPTPKELYSEAIIAREQALANHESATAFPRSSSTKPKIPQFPTAEQEKAALKRYHEAKQAVNRVQNGGYVAAEDAGSLQSSSGPVAYESLFPEGKDASTSAPASANDLPPPFEAPANLIPASHLSEKERLRRQYEEHDAAAMARQKTQQAAKDVAPPPFSPTPINGISSNILQSAISEKEALRRKFEAQDAKAQAMNAAPGYTPQPPPRSNSASLPSSRTPSRGPRPPPAVPSSPGRVLTAAEEKALLKAQYAMQDARAMQQQQQTPPSPNYNAGPSRPTSSAVLLNSTPPPPPLMPRPPVEYIQETQEEDARVARVAMNDDLPLDDGLKHPIPLKPQNTGAPQMDVRPFSPFSAGFDHAMTPPPPLPPKPFGE